MSQRREWLDADFASEMDAAMVQGADPRSRLLLFAIALFFVVALLWAKFAIIDEVTHADGKVIPSSQVQVVQNLEGGILKEVLVEEGGFVEAGAVVLRIDDTSHAATFGELQARNASLLGEIKRLEAEAEGKPLVYSDDMTQGNDGVVEDQQALFAARQAELESQVGILQQQLEQREQEREELVSKIAQAEESLSIANEELEITAPLVEKKIVPKVKLLQLRREINTLKGEISAAKLALPRAESAIAEAKQRVEEKRQHQKSGILGELSQRRAEQQAVQESIAAAKDKVARTEVRSPVKGVVKELKIRTVGGVIKPGEDLMEIIPIEDNLRIEARVRPADIAFLRPEQEAMVKFTAYDFSVYGGLPGKVERISADTILDEQGEAFYKVIVRTETNNLTRGGANLPIIPGMVATVDVITGEKSVLDYLLKPIIKAQQQALRER
jgi:adhesin transport system membrane fusion protein